VHRPLATTDYGAKMVTLLLSLTGEMLPALSTAQSSGMYEPYCGKSVQVLGDTQISSRSTTCSVAGMSVSWQMP
jgi:hypothetical protein